MSTTLFWRKVQPTPSESLGDGLKWAIEKKYGVGPRVLTTENLSFLDGIWHACNENSELARDTKTLMKAIQENDDGVEVWIE